MSLGATQTPLGRSLFYAGEYLRHAVFIEGARVRRMLIAPHPITAALRARPTRLKMSQHSDHRLTDGVESVNYELSDFYHPRVQRRLHHGLGCQALDEVSAAPRVRGSAVPRGRD